MILDLLVPAGPILHHWEFGDTGALMQTCKVIAAETRTILYDSRDRLVSIQIEHDRIRFLNLRFRIRGDCNELKYDQLASSKAGARPMLRIASPSFRAFRHFEVRIDLDSVTRGSDEDYFEILEGCRRVLTNIFE